MRVDLVKLRELYEKGTNIIDYLSDSDKCNSVDNIAISYDLQ